MNFDCPEQELVYLLSKKNMSLSVAESCTGGLISKMITDIAGSSQVFLGGVIVYSNKSKTDILKIEKELLNTKGAVSQEVALKMAESASIIFNSDFSLSATGIAGPEGGSLEKPVGTVYTGFKYNTNNSEVVKHSFTGDREEIRLKTAVYCINHLILYLRNL